MDPAADWINLRDKSYKIFEFFKMSQEFRNLQINYLRIALAKFGGPIAMTRHSDHIVMSNANDPTMKNICFFQNNGTLLSSCPHNEKEKIVGFDFIEDEMLVVVLQDGDFFIIDPFKAERKLGSLGIKNEEEKILEAKFFDNGFVFMNQKFNFYFVLNVYDPYVTKFIDAKLEKSFYSEKVLGSDKSNFSLPFFIPISPKHTISERVEIQITHPKAGIILLQEDEARRVYYNSKEPENFASESLPHLPCLKMMCTSPNHKFIAYLGLNYGGDDNENETTGAESGGFVLHVLPMDFSPNTYSKTNLFEFKKTPKSMVWCAEDCVALVYKSTIELVGPDINYTINVSSKGCFAFPEVDGIKLISNASCDILRRIPDSYVNIFKLLSFEPGALLYEAYSSFENRNPLPDEDIRHKKSDLAQGVNDCIEAGSFELNFEIQSRLLKAGAYGKAFLNPQQIDHNFLSQVCKHLRVVNSMKNELNARTITYLQLKDLDEDVLVKILLRYRAHWLAFEICKYLDLSPKKISQIYVHWACCKVECNESDDVLCGVIYDKLKNEKGISYTEIAHKAKEIGKKQLATKLLEFEPSISKKVPILLSMEKYEKALEDAIFSNDSNLINMVILKLIKTKCSEEYIFELLSANPISKSHLISYYKNFDEQNLPKYYKYLRLYEESGLQAILKAYNTENLVTRVELLKHSLKFFESTKNSFMVTSLHDQISLLQEINKAKGGNKSEKPVNTMLDVFLKKNELKNAQDLQKLCKIPDKRFYLVRFKTLVENESWSELQKVVSEKNRKTQLVPYETISNLIIRANRPDIAEHYILKIPDFDDQIYMLKSINYLQKAAEVAMENKRSDVLEELREISTDTALKKYIDNVLANLNKK